MSTPLSFSLQVMLRLIVPAFTRPLADRTNKRSGRFTLQITSKGFQFLLEDRLAQIWQVLMYYVGIKTVRCLFLVRFW